jgi:prolipoprotein diacylglyceryltransferase
MVKYGPYRGLTVHPTQLYASAIALLCFFLLYLFWRRSQKLAATKNKKRFLTKSGSTFALMFILYGTARFFLEFVRDDNPYEYGWWAIYKGGTISQNLGIYMVIFGFVLMLIFQKMKPKATGSKS